MKKTLTLCLVVFLFSLAIPMRLLASRPVDYLLVGCVMDGMLFSLSNGNGSRGSSPGMMVNWMKVRPSTVNLTPYEGKKIRVRGVLRPGDVFQPDLKTLEILGACDEKARLAVKEELSLAYKEKAEDRAEQEDWDQAWKYINKALSLNKSECSLYLTRAKFYAKQGKLADAVQDARQAVQSGCNRYPDFAFLAELLEKAGNKPAAISAYEQAVASCGYKPDKERFQQSINRLKSTPHTGSQKAGGQAQGGGPTSPGTDKEALPPPPPIPE